MATHQTLTLYEMNDETVGLTITEPDTGQAHDLTGAELEMVLKPDADTPDTDPGVVILGTLTGEITVDDAANGLATATVNRGHLAEPGDRWWRVDVVRPGTRRTAAYGPLRVTNL